MPGYALAIARMDRIGHRRLRSAGFAMMVPCLAVIGAAPGMFTRVFLHTLLPSGLGRRGTLLLTVGVSVTGLALTLVLPSPAGQSPEEIAPGLPDARPVPLLTADQAPA